MLCGYAQHFGTPLSRGEYLIVNAISIIVSTFRYVDGPSRGVSCVTHKQSLTKLLIAEAALA